MKRLNLKQLFLHATIVSSTFLITSAAWAEQVIRVGSWLPPQHTMNKDVLPTWGKWIEEATEGRVKLKIEFPGGDPKALLDQVQDGTYEAAWTFHGYYPGRFKLTKAVELPGMENGAEAASMAHWRVFEKYFAKAGEHEGVAVMGLFTHAPGQIHLAKPIEKLADLKGKKLRIGGGVQTDIGNKLGIEGVAAPASKVYELLSQGVADGAMLPMGEKKTLRIKEVAPFTLKFPNGLYLGSFVIVMNEDFLAGLDEKDREAIKKVSGEKLSVLAGKYWNQEAIEGEADARASGNTIMEATDEMKKELAELTKDFDQSWIDSVKDRNVDAKAALDELRALARDYKSGN
ncbi:MAG: TRAP transporter substrate-binding protein [Thiofilum sp.]|uniref:TRAP transporter substrate-binding protein n=1 Tax=Thiofilum sp. TaxID=2212733 RepID=UPI0025E5691C|nr:TRAP transporter substrate-binding protein [Thiofilum sp.]MBK8454274.1 TRAP transporter substrate-binding protein [Thiofilum sp.]